MFKQLIIVTLLSLSTLGVVGCAEPSPYEREGRIAIDNENWETCKLVYRNELVATVSTHTHLKGRLHRPDQVKDDLFDNHCRFILRHYWIMYN